MLSYYYVFWVSLSPNRTYIFCLIIIHLERGKKTHVWAPGSSNYCFEVWNKKADELQGWRLIAVVRICVHVCSWGHWACHWVHFCQWTRDKRDCGIIMALRWKWILIKSGRGLSCSDLLKIISTLILNQFSFHNIFSFTDCCAPDENCNRDVQPL